VIGFASRFIAGAAAPVAPMRSYRGRRVSREPSQITVANWSLDVARALSAPERISLRVQGWPERTLERLLPFADKVERLIIEAAIPDLSGLSSFDSLKELSISGPVEAIDFSALRRLEILRLSGQIPSISALATCPSLRVLSINGAALPDLKLLSGVVHLTELEVAEAPLESLTGLEQLTSLVRLALFDVQLTDLGGIETATNLAELGLHRLRRLRSVASLAAVPLKTLIIDSCRKIGDIERLGVVKTLEELQLTGVALSSADFLTHLSNLRFLTLQNVGRLPSLEFIRDLARLETFALAENTVVENGDLARLLQMPALRVVGFTDRRHYSHRQEDIQTVLTDRGTVGTGSFDNYMAQHWSTLLKARNLQLGKMMLAGVLRDALALENREIPARLGQYAITAVEVLARLRGDVGEKTVRSAFVDDWVRRHPYEPPAAVVDSAVKVLDRLVLAPSGLLSLWGQRGQAKEWMHAVNELKQRLVLSAKNGQPERS